MLMQRLKLLGLGWCYTFRSWGSAATMTVIDSP